MLDHHNDRPLYKQLADVLRDAIASGSPQEGEKLPSESQLQIEHSVSAGTVRQAIALLRAEGLVESAHGRGVFVRSRPKTRRLAYDRFARAHRERGKSAFLAEAELTGAKPSVSVHHVGKSQCPESVKPYFDDDIPTEVLVRKRTYYLDGQPTEYATSYIPWAIASGTPMTQENPGPGGIYARLEESGHMLAEFHEDISARPPSVDEAAKLVLAEGIPVIDIHRSARDTSGKVVEVCMTTLAADRYTLSYVLPAT